MEEFSLKGMRELVMSSFPETTFELKVEDFFKELLPSTSPATVTKIMAKLRTKFTHELPGQQTRGRTFEAAIVNNRWRWFAEDPAQSDLKEDTVFQDMNRIFDSVEAAAEVVTGNPVKTKTQIQATIADRSGFQNGTFKNDANQRLLVTSLCDSKDIGGFQHFSADSVTSWELKKFNTWEKVNQVSSGF